MTKTNLPPKENWELAEELLARFPGVDRAALLKDMVSMCFTWMRCGNKREERAACDFLNELQRLAAVEKTIEQINRQALVTGFEREAEWEAE